MMNGNYRINKIALHILEFVSDKTFKNPRKLTQIILILYCLHRDDHYFIAIYYYVFVYLRLRGSIAWKYSVA